MFPTLLQRNLGTPGARLKYLRSILRLTRAYIEKQYKLPEITLKSWENGTIKLSKNGIKRCVAVYKNEGLMVDESWLADGKGLDPTVRLSIGYYFAAPSDANLPMIESDEIAMMQDANDFKNKYPNAVIMIVPNDEMSPYYEPGDYVGGRLRKGNALSAIVNKDCIVCLKNGKQYFRRIMQDSFSHYNLVCLNPMGKIVEPVVFDVDIQWAAPVSWIRKRDDN
jgi:hypothetical protein